MELLLTNLVTKTIFTKQFKICNLKQLPKHFCSLTYLVELPTDNLQQYKLAKRYSQYIKVKGTIRCIPLLKKFKGKEVKWCFDLDQLTTLILENNLDQLMPFIQFYSKLKSLRETVYFYTRYTKRPIYSMACYVLDAKFKKE